MTDLRPLLASVPITPQRIRLIAQRDNDVYRVDAAEGTFALRLHPEGTDAAQVAGELRWLSHLAPRMGSRIPRPLTDPIIHDGRVASLLAWVHGRFPRKPTEDFARAVGRTLAEMHRAGEGFDAHGLPRWDVTDRFGDGFLQKLDRIRGLMESEDHTFVLRRAGGVQRFLSGYEGSVGVLHADLQGGNTLWQRGELGVIDFANAGLGPLVYDLAVATRHVPPELVPILVRAYRRVRPLSEDDERASVLLRQARMLESLAYAGERLARPGPTYRPEKIVAWGLRSLRGQSDLP